MSRGHNFKDLTGKKFDSLNIIGVDRIDKNYRVFYKCRCDCGKELIRRSDLITDKRHYSSCGCTNPKKDKLKTNRYYYKKLYYIRYGMLERCFNKKAESYKWYGAKGIKVCDEWLNSDNFIEWSLQNGYKEGLSIERIDTNGDYCPENCKWIQLSEQSNNTCRNINITYKDKTLNINQWAKELGINKNTFWRYIRVKNYSIDYIINHYQTNYSREVVRE